jgi:hypothetical protein
MGCAFNGKMVVFLYRLNVSLHLPGALVSIEKQPASQKKKEKVQNLPISNSFVK